MKNVRPSITAFFPAYNDAGTIASMVISAMNVLEQLTDDYEIIVINDGSHDQTPEILNRLAADYERVRVIHHPQNRGYGGALRSGFAAATKDLIFYTDGDAQYDVRDLLRLYPLMTENIDLVQGYKRERHDGLLRTVIGQCYHFTVKQLFMLTVRDVDCDFRLMRRRIFEKVELTHNSGVICVEMVKKIESNGFGIAELDVSHFPRSYGHSQFFRWRHLFNTAKELSGLWQELMLARRFSTYAPQNNVTLK